MDMSHRVSVRMEKGDAAATIPGGVDGCEISA
jgi:hypothetical protein